MLRRRWSKVVLFSWLAVSLAGCNGDDGPTGLDPAVFELAIVSGGGQSGLAGTVVDEPLVARVSRRDGGTPEEGVTVSWGVVSGSGTPTRTTSVTNVDGEASTRVELGSVAGAVAVEASVPGLGSVRFSDLTVLAAPSIASLSVTSADPGDTIEVRVNDLSAGVAAQVLFDGVAGEIVDQTPGAPTVLDVVVPAPIGVCSSTSVSVPVRLRADGVTTAAIALSVSVPANPFQVGQVLVIEGTADASCALLPSDGGNAKYLLVALSAAFEQQGNFQVTLGAGSVALSAADASAAPAATGFHDKLRAIESRLADKGLPMARPESGPQLFAGPTIGDQRDFWVASDLEAINAGQIDENAFERVTGTLRFVGGNTLLFLDDAVPSNGLTQGDIEMLGELYDRHLYETDVDFFGEPTDVDDNNKTIVLLSPVVNSLTERGSNGVVIGFVFLLDLFDPNTSGCPECRFSNGAEILYGLVPDPDGVHSDPRTRERVLALLPGVMIHETQHMINWRYKVFESVVPGLDRLWLGEGLAHMAEEKGGDALFDLGDIEQANNLYQDNFARVASYLAAPDSFSLTATEGGLIVGARGGWWLFLRWIAEQYGDFILRDLTQEAERGVANVEARTGESFFRLFADFAVAAWADDLAIAGLQARYTVPKWNLREIVQVQPQGGGDPVYALQPLQMTFSTFRGSSINEFLAATSPFYVELDAAGDPNSLQLQLEATTDAGLAILRYE
ncbi:MAG: hypothetical protein GWN99_11900 [Gemmatimonadetes bacterium]|uniref:Big-1 domain-containing protein n=1 Tax=Candidatus Kutchimonas denitrificans TaxID=3056748 RepID=A0AAE5CCA6_9BACT|nr:hypothetical protein [Gemmatimonadota bacterium]NIR75435.1 hypothetical protein [Candidatus Kutchimonas denitrificans]NIS01749.1 hypothetical protein [Gemmatimonadota bacterium]NIT67531.1 hypothetical protein [Gemmatimonadota bacterium]NIU53394.1 hypothetical protein [Gemmatimonadota bacterium]